MRICLICKIYIIINTKYEIQNNTKYKMSCNYNLYKNMCLDKNTNDSNIFSYIPSLIPSFMFYSMFGYYIVKFINYIKLKDADEDADEDAYEAETQDNYEKQNKSLNHHKKNYKYQYPDNKMKLLNVVSLDTDTPNEIKKKQNIIHNMLSQKTLERSLIIYYIFIKKGDFKIITKNEETNELSFEEYNSYLEFKKYDAFYHNSNIKNNKNNNNNKNNDDYDYTKNFYEINELFNLDNSLENKKTFIIGEKDYIINEGQLNMISWIYYSGLYEYLTKNIQLKYKILKAMYNDNLLTSNLFLRYQLFLQDNAALITELEKNEAYEESDELVASDYSEDVLEDEIEEDVIDDESNKDKNYKNFKIINIDNLDNLEDTNFESVTYSDSDSSESILEIDFTNDLDEIKL